MIPRFAHRRSVEALLRDYRVVAIVGARQVGKTTLARQVAGGWKGPVSHFDLEDPRDFARLSDPALVLGPRRGLVILDEIQRRPDLFPILRVLADRPRGARFLVLGSASPDLIRGTSETLAGRIAHHRLTGFAVGEVGIARARRLWERGGFPRSFTAPTAAKSARWRREFVQTFLERDIPQLGVSVPMVALRRLWSMLAHLHGQTLNLSELGRSMGLADTTVRGYVEILAGAFMVRLLPPWHENVAKRQVKAPKAYLTDSGILHTLLGIENAEDLDAHPKVGASWEGFCIANVVDRLGARPDECYYWATHAGAELDLLVVRGRQRRGFEIKYSDSPPTTKSMQVALQDLKLDQLEVIHAGRETYALGDRIRAVGMADVMRRVDPL